MSFGKCLVRVNWIDKTERANYCHKARGHKPALILKRDFQTRAPARKRERASDDGCIHHNLKERAHVRTC